MSISKSTKKNMQFPIHLIDIMAVTTGVLQQKLHSRPESTMKSANQSGPFPKSVRDRDLSTDDVGQTWRWRFTLCSFAAVGSAVFEHISCTVGVHISVVLSNIVYESVL
uniref:Uncharacterized protein n=1 Tax=Spongospora subterranea TaxID=70186 RepID=A0A0H5QMV8_9EUKA|eukprot:CRZ03302.1 hypothetical protein [Spongospora subterranea]